MTAQDAPAAGPEQADLARELQQQRHSRHAKPRRISLSEVAQHSTKESGWIAVNGKVYDTSSFIQTHPGWDCACGISTVIAILRCLGTDCTEEFNAIHTAAAHSQLRAYYIGELAAEAAAAAGAAQPGPQHHQQQDSCGGSKGGHRAQPANQQQQRRPGAGYGGGGQPTTAPRHPSLL
jgi:cytochrome b involved in lipid metabolism